MTLEKFLIKNKAYPSDLFNYAKDMTLKEFYHNCQCSEQIIWLFTRTNPSDIKQLVLTAAHCANACRHLLEDERSLKAIDAAMNFESYSEIQLYEIYRAVVRAARYVADAANAANAARYVAADAANAANAAYYAAAANAAYYAAAANAANAADAADVAAYAARAAADALGDKKLIADIVRKHLPLEIWNQEIINN